MRALKLTFLVILLMSTARADFVIDNTALPTTKTDLHPIPIGADPTKYFQALDYNDLMHASLDLRTGLMNGTMLGLAPQGSTPNPTTAHSNYSLFVNASHQLIYNQNGVLVNLHATLQSAYDAGQTIVTGPNILEIVPSPNPFVLSSKLDPTLADPNTDVYLYVDNSGAIVNSGLFHNGTNAFSGLEMNNATVAGIPNPVEFSQSVTLLGQAYNPTTLASNVTGLNLVAIGVSANPTTMYAQLGLVGDDGVGWAPHTQWYSDGTTSLVGAQPRISLNNGASAALSASGTGALRYNNSTHAIEASKNGGAYSQLLDAASAQTITGIKTFDAASALPVFQRNALGAATTPGIDVRNNTVTSGGDLVESAPSIRQLGRVWDGAASQVVSSKTALTSISSGASYDADWSLLMDAHGNEVAMIEANYNGTQQAVMLPGNLLGYDGGNLHPLPAGTLTLLQQGDTLTSNIITNAFVGPDYGGTSTNIPTVTWTPFPYANSWADFGAPYNNAGYHKDEGGRVCLRGLVKGSSATTDTIGTLPVGYRPAGQVRYFASYDGSFSGGSTAGQYIQITTAGVVSVAAGTHANYAAGVGFDNVCYYAGN